MLVVEMQHINVTHKDQQQNTPGGLRVYPGKFLFEESC